MKEVRTVLESLNNVGIDPVKAVIGSVSDVFQWEEQKVNEMKGYLLSENFRYHYEHNAYYRMLCDNNDITPADIQDF
jgi:long-chain-fatty-acid---luciferin-component ligase